MEIKLCKDCKHMRGNVVLFWDRWTKPWSYYRFAKCQRPQKLNNEVIANYLVTGMAEQPTANEYCSLERSYENHPYKDTCGKAGKYFELKEKKN